METINKNAQVKKGLSMLIESVYRSPSDSRLMVKYYDSHDLPHNRPMTRVLRTLTLVGAKEDAENIRKRASYLIKQERKNGYWRGQDN